MWESHDDRFDCNAANRSRPHAVVDQNVSNSGTNPEKSERGRWGGYYRGTIYFTEHSFKIMQNFTLKGGGGGGEGVVPLDL